MTVNASGHLPPFPYFGGKSAVADVALSMEGTFAPGWMPARSFGCAFGAPTRATAGFYKSGHGPINKLRSMLSEMLRLCHDGKIFQTVVQRVAVLVMNDVTMRNGASFGFPDHDSAQFPYRRTGYFDPRPAHPASLVPSANHNRPDQVTLGLTTPVIILHGQLYPWQ